MPRPITPILLLLFHPLSMVAQLHSAPRDLAGGGTYEGCNPSLEVDFTGAITGYLTYRFEPQVVSGSTLPYANVWSYYDGSFQQVFSDTLTHTFPAPGEHLVCLTVNAFDLQAQQPCSTTTCRLEPILQDASCADLIADFTILEVDGQTISFTSLSSFGAGFAQELWSFGDGSIASIPAPAHTFDGSGPHEICLTLVGNGPAACTATVCKWLYLGPAPVGCEVLLHPGFLLLQEQNFVGVLDTSTTSGMSSSVEWSFGDGGSATGRWAIHAYAQDGAYELCSTIRLWGPLVEDTCTTVLCATVYVFEMLNVEEAAMGHDLTAHPVPFTDQLWLQGMPAGAGRLTIHDAQGRLVHDAWHVGTGLMRLDLGHLAPGIHTIQVLAADQVKRMRVLKE